MTLDIIMATYYYIVWTVHLLCTYAIISSYSYCEAFFSTVL